MSPADVSPEEALTLLQNLEDYFSSPEFTSAIGDFLSAKSHEVDYVAQEAEQPMKNYLIFQQYTAMVEAQLERWLSTEGHTPQEVFSACQLASTTGEANWLTCIDYLLASTEYESFMELAYDHFVVSTSTYELGEDAEAWAPGTQGSAHHQPMQAAANGIAVLHIGNAMAAVGSNS